MKTLITIFTSMFFSNLISMMLFSSAYAQFAFELPKRDPIDFPSYEEIHVKITGKLILYSLTDKGHILLEVTGGLPPYSFKWNNRVTSKNRINLHSGTYTVEIIDAAGNKLIEQVIIHPPLESKLNSSAKKSNSASLKKMKLDKTRTNFMGKKQN